MISAIECLDGLRDLRKLDLSHNRIDSARGLDALDHLETLDLSANQMCEPLRAARCARAPRAARS